MSSGNDEFVGLIRSLCERTRISRILDLQHRENAATIFGGLKALVAALRDGKDGLAIDILKEQIDGKRARMQMLAEERSRRIYAANPLLRPGAGR